MMIWDGINKRRFPRIQYKCRIRIKEHQQEEVFDTHTENIGAGGICVILAKEFDLFKTANLELYLEEGKPPINCEGAIVWVIRRGKTGQPESYDYDIGIEFTDISDEDRDKIVKLVESVLEK